MRIHLAYDHATFALGSQLAESLGKRLEGSGDGLIVHAPLFFDDGDDYPQFTIMAALAMVNDQDRGVDAVAVVLGSSPTGALIAANKVKGVRAVLGNDGHQVRQSRRVDDTNVLVVNHRHVEADTAMPLVAVFCEQAFDLQADHVRRVVQVMEFETSGTIAGWELDCAEAAPEAGRGAEASGALALVYSEFGEPSVLHVEPVPEQHPGRAQVRVAVKVAGLNPIDAKLRSGLYAPPDSALPRGIGQDFAGIVDEAGPGARYADGSAVAVGDHVLGWTDTQGAARTQLVVPADNLARKPATLEWEVAGALQTAALTAQASIDVLDIGADDVVLVSAAAGGVGLVYAQLALARGAIVVGTAGPGNQAYLRSFGIIPVRYGPGLADRVRAAVPRPLTGVQDNHGREAVLAGLELGLPPDRIVAIADHAAVDELGLASPGRYQRSASTLSTLAQAAAAGQLRLPVQTFPFDHAAAAYEWLESGHGRGKVALCI